MAIKKLDKSVNTTRLDLQRLYNKEDCIYKEK